MDVSPPSSPGTGNQPQSTPALDPRLQPTPDYGTLGPGSDIAAASVSDARTPGSPAASTRRFQPVMAIALGVLFALLVKSAGSAHAAWEEATRLLSVRQSTAPNGQALAKDPSQVDRLKPQKQAEALLELAVSRSDGAVDQISSRVDRWQGKIQWNSQIATLTTAALNSNDMRVRGSGIEVELAAYGLGKNAASLEYLLKNVESADHSRKVWALWALGLEGNRGVETQRVVQVLNAHRHDSDANSRYWAVQGLALTGATEAIPLLLQSMHDDPAPNVREAAACSLAASGMFTDDQRFSVVPQLLNYTDDPALDAQTHAWAFQALGDITHQRLGNDSAAWRTWYQGGQN